MYVQLRFFASMREGLQTAAEIIDVPPTVATVEELRAWLRQRGDPWSAALADDRAFRMALDRKVVDGGALLRPDCEVAFFPPVTGG